MRGGKGARRAGTIWTDVADAELASLWAAGWSISAIGGMLGATRGSVISAIRRLELPPPPPGTPKQTLQNTPGLLRPVDSLSPVERRKRQAIEKMQREAEAPEPPLKMRARMRVDRTKGDLRKLFEEAWGNT